MGTGESSRSVLESRYRSRREKTCCGYDFLQSEEQFAKYIVQDILRSGSPTSV